MTRTITIPHAEKLGVLVLLAFSAAIVSLSGRISEGRTPANDPGPAFFPRLIAGAIAFLAIYHVVLLAYRGESTSHEIPLDVATDVGVVFALLVAYVWSMDTLGFFLASIVFLLVLQLYSGERDPRVLAGVSIGLPLVLVFVFGRLFHVPLPENEYLPVSRLLRWSLGVLVTPRSLEVIDRD